MALSYTDYERLDVLNRLVREKRATKEQTDEYMELMFRYGQLTPKQYQDYREGRHADIVVSAALGIAGTFLLLYVLDKLLSSK